jgi:hypothetical protein
MGKSRGVAMIAAGGLVLGGCGAGELSVVTPPPPPTTDLTLVLQPLAEDAAIAATLGWSLGIPDAEIVITPLASNTSPTTVRSNGNGQVVINLPTGDYEISASRWLSLDERAATPAIEGVTGWAARVAKKLGASGTVPVALAASRRRSLLVSEWWFNNRIDPVLGESYGWGGYIELVNNSDSTIYLDGIVIGRAIVSAYENPVFPCAGFAPLTLDPGGVWIGWSNTFPGDGADYPLRPGELVLVATDAIDHSEIIVDGPDLRGADFESIGPADVDNPAVPNMVDSGPGAFVFHGMNFPSIYGVLALALPVNVASLQTAVNPYGSNTYSKIPRAAILDVVSHVSYLSPSSSLCSDLFARPFDRGFNMTLLQYPSEQERFPFSLHRTLTRPGSGPAFYQSTKNSATDFTAAQRSPGLP